jgi:hypothetical protein
MADAPITVEVAEHRVDSTDEPQTWVHHLELDITDSSGETHRAILDAPLTVAGRPKQIRRVERNEQGQISRIVDE